MYIYKDEIEKYQRQGYILMDVLDIELFKNKLAIYNYNFLDKTKNELIKHGLDLNNHDLKDSLMKYVQNKSLDGTIFLFKENYLAKGLIHQHLKQIHTKHEFVPIYLTSLFIKENYLQVFKEVETIKKVKSLEKLERLFLVNEKRQKMYHFLNSKDNLFTLNDYLTSFLYNEEKMDLLFKKYDIPENEKEFLLEKKLKIDEFLKTLLFLSKKEINPSLVNNLIYSLYYYELNFFFNVILIDFELNMENVFNELRITKDYKRKEIMILFHDFVEEYEKYNRIYELIEMSKLMKRQFLVNQHDYSDILFILD